MNLAIVKPFTGLIDSKAMRDISRAESTDIGNDNFAGVGVNKRDTEFHSEKVLGVTKPGQEAGE